MRETWEENAAEEIISETDGALAEYGAGAACAEAVEEPLAGLEAGTLAGAGLTDGACGSGQSVPCGTAQATVADQAGDPQGTDAAPQVQPVQPAQDVPISMDTVAGFEAMQRVAKLYLASSFVGDLFKKQGAMGIANATVALEIARRLNMPPLLVMQNMYLVGGKVGWTAQFLIASFNATGRFTPIRYQMAGTFGEDSFGCRAQATEVGTGFEHQGPLVTIGMARAEGWAKNRKWQTMPELMLRYRAAAFLIRTCAPEVAMGLYTAEELQDVAAAEAGKKEMKQVNWESSPWGARG